jgi:pantetheine-phosphate adenylyltransferase
MDVKRVETLGIYAGSFNPFHMGHWDVAQQAAQIFDRVLVARGINPEKANVERYQFPEHVFDGHPKFFPTVKEFDGLVTDLVGGWERSGYDVTLVRGLRTVVDLTEEQNYIAFLRSLKPNIKVTYFLCHPEYQHISSKALRGLENLAPVEFGKYTFAR